MTEPQMKKFAEKALKIKMKEEKLPATFGESITRLLEVERKEDEGSSLWAVLNRVQEKLTHGSYKITSTKGKVRKAVGIKNFQNDIKLNQGLWKLAEQYL